MCEFARESGTCPLNIENVSKKGSWCADYSQQAHCGNERAEIINRYFIHRSSHQRNVNRKHENPFKGFVGLVSQDSIEMSGSTGHYVEKKHEDAQHDEDLKSSKNPIYGLDINISVRPTINKLV